MTTNLDPFSLDLVAKVQFVTNELPGYYVVLGWNEANRSALLLAHHEDQSLVLEEVRKRHPRAPL